MCLCHNFIQSLRCCDRKSCYDTHTGLKLKLLYIYFIVRVHYCFCVFCIWLFIIGFIVVLLLLLFSVIFLSQLTILHPLLFQIKGIELSKCNVIFHKKPIINHPAEAEMLFSSFSELRAVVNNCRQHDTSVHHQPQGWLWPPAR